MTNFNTLYKSADRDQAVINHRNGRLVVIAGPGTGKTTSFLKLIKALDEEGIEGNKLCYLTFMRAITNEFISDIQSNAITKGLKGAQDAWKLTVHSLAWRIILALSASAGMPKDLEILGFDRTSERSEHDFCCAILKDVVANLKKQIIDLSTARVWRILDEWRSLRQKNISALDSLSSDERAVVACIKEHFRALHLLDWDMVIPVAQKVIAKAGLPKWVSDIKFFLVDEYQDFNPSEAAFLNHLEKQSTAMVVVGDDDQSLFSGRSAAPATLRACLADPTSNTVNFTICYRCPKSIVTSANHYLQVVHGASAKERIMSPKHNAPDGAFEVLLYKSAKAECDALADRITKDWIPTLQGFKEKKKRDHIIGLFPNKKLLKQYKVELEKRGIECTTREEDEDSETFTMRNLLLLAYYRGHPLYDRYLLQQYSNLARRYPSLIWNLVRQGTSIPTAIQTLLDEGNLTAKAATEAEEYLSLHATLLRGQPGELVKVLPVPVSLEDIQSILDCADRAEVDSVLQSIVQGITDEESEPENAEIDEPQDVPIRLMTMHSCKGLTKRFVFIPGCEDYWMPGKATGEKLAEKKRLMYVALTRSKEQVIITCPKTRAKGDSLNLRQDGCGRMTVIPKLFGVTPRSVW